MSLTLGPLGIDDPSAAAFDSGDDGWTVQLTGTVASPELAGSSTADRIARAHRRREDLLSMRGTVQPLTWTDDTSHNGLWSIDAVSADLETLTARTVLYRWSATLTRRSGWANIEVESRLSGVGAANDHGATPERWHAPPPAHQGYYTGATHPASIVRQAQGFDLRVYRDVPAADPLWLLPEAVQLDQCAARINGGTPYQAIVGTAVPPFGAAVAQNNKLFHAYKDTGSWIFTEAWIGGGGYYSGQGFTVRLDGVTVGNWDPIAILRNDPEQTAVRYAARGLTRLTLDLTLTRGARFVAGYLRTHAAATLAVGRESADPAVAPAAGVIMRDTALAAGERWVLGSARSFTADLPNGVISRASTVDLDFFIGHEVPTSGVVQPGDTAADLLDQYLGTPAVRDAVVRR